MKADMKIVHYDECVSGPLRCVERDTNASPSYLRCKDEVLGRNSV